MDKDNLVMSYYFSEKDRELGLPILSEENKEYLIDARSERGWNFIPMKQFVDSKFKSGITQIDIVYRQPACVIIDNSGIQNCEYLERVPTRNDIYASTDNLVILAFYQGSCWQHFVQDSLPFIVLYLQLLQLNPQFKIVMYIPGFDSWKLFMDSYNIRNEVILVHSGQILSTTGKIFTLKIHGERYPAEYPLNLVRNGFQCIGALNCVIEKRNKLIWITRKGLNQRTIENEDEVCNMLKEFAAERKLEFEFFDCNKTALDDRIDLFRKARMVVALHGGSNYNVIFCAPKTVFVEVCFGRLLHELNTVAKGKDLEYIMHIETDYGHSSQNIKLNVARLKAEIEKIKIEL